MAKKATHQTDRTSIRRFEEIINIGPASKGDFERLGFKAPQDLIGQDPTELYQNICSIDNLFHDPCVLDVFIATIDYMNGNSPQTWWSYTDLRKQKHAAVVDSMREFYLK